jgi:hypothetical protein
VVQISDSAPSLTTLLILAEEGSSLMD